MKFIADFHIHSHFSIATSKELRPECLDYWAGIKGLKVVGSGDFTHPGWVKELEQKLVPAEPGLYRLKDNYLLQGAADMPGINPGETRFILTAEISNIYKKNDRIRKVHNLVFAPDFKIVRQIQKELKKIGNITSDGPPILGMDSKDLLDLLLNVSAEIFFVPAHIWTPWFSILGSKSGFDSVQECFEDLTSHIYAVETGLSTDPPLNWMCSFLDKYTLISNSDAHSPQRLARNANIFHTDLSYRAITQALTHKDPARFLGTIDLFPQEGKYHYDGHRKCRICLDPVRTLKYRGRCPKCGRQLTIGVVSRVAQLADRAHINTGPGRMPFHYIIPVKELLSEIYKKGINTNFITNQYNQIIKKAGSELALLLELPVADISRLAGELLGEAIKRMRQHQVIINEGFDGQYGIIRVFRKDELSTRGQTCFFARAENGKPPLKRPLINFDLDEFRALQSSPQPASLPAAVLDRERSFNRAGAVPPQDKLNKIQQQAAAHMSGPAMILAGPGTGKTHTLAMRIYNLIAAGIPAQNILAVTFTNRAAAEMAERISILGTAGETELAGITICTFHALGYRILSENFAAAGRRRNFFIIDEDDKQELLLAKVGADRQQAVKLAAAISSKKQRLKQTGEIRNKHLQDNLKKYEELLAEYNLFDIDDLIFRPVLLLADSPALRELYQKRYQWLMIDEYQDINYAQYQLIRLLTPRADSNLVVIGDPNQAIYGFRGSDIRFINKFAADFPAASVYELALSYRCSGRILKASGSILNAEVKGNPLSALQEGVKISIASYRTDRSEAEQVARIIEKISGGLRFFSMDSGISLGDEQEEIKSLADIAVLARLRRQFKRLEKAFADHAIPYKIIGESPLLADKGIRLTADLLKLDLEPDNSYLKEKLSKPKGLKLAALMPKLHLEKSVYSRLECIIRDKFVSKQLKDTAKADQLLAIAGNYAADSTGFLRHISLGVQADTLSYNTECVHLLTLHSVKGLEFPCVFIIGCEQGLLPYNLFEKYSFDEDEERRLLYVGMTRAQRLLFISHAATRNIFGRTYNLKRSPFLDRIEEELFELKKDNYKKKTVKEEKQLKMF